MGVITPVYRWRGAVEAIEDHAPMRRTAFALFILFAVALGCWHTELFQSRKTMSARLDPTPGEERVAAARAASGEKIAAKVRAAGMAYPPRELFLRAYKQERELEVWGGSGGELKKIAVFPVLAASGGPGPKRREGDKQVPEGCYRVVVFNPKSHYHLSLGLDYPNASDRVLSDPEKPGFDIYIHGGAASVGCLALGDDAIEELFLLASDTLAKDAIAVHLFPARPPWDELKAAHPRHAELWAQLELIHAAFEQTRRVPKVRSERDGRYTLAD
jgi:murein L,D-transpeptidase YafK